MCGIAGAFQLQSVQPFQDEETRRALQTMARRGPDDEGLFAANGVILGHRRLSIIDLSPAGHQPFVDEPTGVALVFNGEIFNFRALKKCLEEKGRAFRTHSDTEVLLQSYLEWGREALRHLSGMFAFALYDPRDQSLLLARDRTGIKPLFYSQAGGQLYFASSFPALLSYAAVERRPDWPAISHYLTTIRTTLGERTLLADVRTLLPGTYLLARRGTAPQVCRYWDFPVLAPADKENPPLEAAAAEMRRLLADSVSEQLVSDVPLGGFLSGGVDSSVLATLAQTMTGGHYNAYSVGYDIEGFNEWPFVQKAASRYGMWCREIHLRPEDYPQDWHWLVREKGLPLSTPNEVPIYHLARALRQDFTVALSGEGADEVLGGYTMPYFSAYDYERARHVPAADQEPLNATDRAMRRLYRRPFLLDPVDHHFLLNSWIPMDLKHALFTPAVAESLRGDAVMLDHYHDLYRRFERCSRLDQYMQVHARINLEGLLFRVDSSTMAASVEARVPYTSHHLVEYLFRLPDHLKMAFRSAAATQQAALLNIAEIDRKNLIDTKILLRQAFAADIDEEILRRRKMSFPVPVREWFHTLLKPMAQEVLAASPLPGTWFDTARLQQLLATTELPTSCMPLWPIVNLCLWAQNIGLP